MIFIENLIQILKQGYRLGIDGILMISQLMVSSKRESKPKTSIESFVGSSPSEQQIIDVLSG